MIWTTQKRKISELIPAKYNPRKLTDKQAEDLDKSLTKFNLADPIIINKNNVIIGGHQRVNILKKQGVTEVDCRVPGTLLSVQEEKELNLRLNKNLGEWDFDLLKDFGEEMLSDVGFDSDEIDKAFCDINKPDDDDVPAARKSTNIKLGDRFWLGNHILMCGDSTKKGDVEKLMQGEKADMSFTSPPYNVGHNLGYDGKKSKYINSNDNLNNYIDLIIKSTELSLDFAKDVFVNIQFLANNKKSILLWLSKISDYFKDIFFWRKLQVQPAMAKNVANSAVEVIVLFGKNNNTRSFGNKEFRGDFSNYIETNSSSKENKNAEIHNATFPVGLPSIFIEHAYNRNSIVLDLFGGSGSTLIACEKLNRQCRMMEIDPIYCQVIIDRWEQLTNNKAIKL